LSKFPDKFIYEPWTAPKAVQEKCGCIVGKDYPKPIVDHDTARKANIARMAAAYAKRKSGMLIFHISYLTYFCHIVMPTEPCTLFNISIYKIMTTAVIFYL